MMLRRDDLTFRQEMKFRNKLVEYLTDWIMGNSHQLNVQGDVCLVSRYGCLVYHVLMGQPAACVASWSYHQYLTITTNQLSQ